MSARNAETDGMFVINEAGQIFSFDVEKANLIPYINQMQNIPNKSEFIFRLAQRFHLPSADVINQLVSAS